MNKQELIKKMAEKAGITQAVAEKALTAFTDTVTETLAKGEKVQLVGFGTFETTVRQARKGVKRSRELTAGIADPKTTCSFFQGRKARSSALFFALILSFGGEPCIATII